MVATFDEITNAHRFIRLRNHSPSDPKGCLLEFGASHRREGNGKAE